MEELRKLALEATGGDEARADALLLDPDERLRLEEKLRAADATRRLEAWRALRPRAQWAVLPVIVAFAIGLSFGGGLGLLRPAPNRALAVNARTLSGPYEGVEPLELVFWLDMRGAVVVHVERSSVDIGLDGEPRTEAVLDPGLHRLRLSSRVGSWSAGRIHLEEFPAPDPGAGNDEIRENVRKIVEKAEDHPPYVRWIALHNARLFLLAAAGGNDDDYRSLKRQEEQALEAFCALSRREAEPSPDQPCFFKR